MKKLTKEFVEFFSKEYGAIFIDEKTGEELKIDDSENNGTESD